MKQDPVNRRDFHKLTMAAMGGMMAGSVIGCAGKKTEKSDAKSNEEGAGNEKPGGGSEVAEVGWAGLHVCRGLNACKGKGKTGKNACAGQGECASPKVKHACNGQNACKNQGGCGDTAGSNACKGKGGCSVPLMEDAWKTAYKKFKADMEKAGKADMLPKEPPGPPKTEAS